MFLIKQPNVDRGYKKHYCGYNSYNIAIPKPIFRHAPSNNQSEE